MWLKWLPWRYVVSSAARAHGFIDPINVLGYLHRFAQPSEVAEPLELLRAGVVFHARGLMNTRAIQHNLDWVWPYWVERQFDPADSSFIPRAFSVTHVNLTHRNWTAVGKTDYKNYALVDPRGLLTPFYDSWSIDFWVIFNEHSKNLFPSKLIAGVSQELDLNGSTKVTTQSRNDYAELETSAFMEDTSFGLSIAGSASAKSNEDGFLIAAFRPYNPEGVSFIHDFNLPDQDISLLKINKESLVKLHPRPDKWRFSRYSEGDAAEYLPDCGKREKIECNVGMATACAVYPLKKGRQLKIKVEIPLSDYFDSPRASVNGGNPAEKTAEISLPDPKFEFLFKAAHKYLLLFSPTDGTVVAGPFTYKRFWHRDAAFMLNALLTLGHIKRAEKILSHFPKRQSKDGYFLSQEGEWDSNGQVLWIFMRYSLLSGKAVSQPLLDAAIKGARWMLRKRLAAGNSSPEAGLMPAGFSAEHLGPNDHYYWDNYWSVAGFKAAAYLTHKAGLHDQAVQFEEEGESYAACIENSIAFKKSERRLPGIPAAPRRRMDAGAIGSIVCAYPLQLYPPESSAVAETVNFLMNYCFVKGGFFQDMIHSGINPYLTLHIAQTMLRAGDTRFIDLVNTVAGLASPTGQWPEAIHPATGGGCMGDGQHGWAAAEWALMLKNMLVREEKNILIFCSGIPAGWLKDGDIIRFGPVYTEFGSIELRVESTAHKIFVSWNPNWLRRPDHIEIILCGKQINVTPSAGEYEFRRSEIE